MIDTINQFGAQWLRFFGLDVLQDTVFLILVFFALYLVRNSSARVRYAIAFVGLVKVLLPPVFPLPNLVPSLNSLSGALVSSPVFITDSAAAAPVPGNSPAPVLNVAGILFFAWAAFILVYLSLTGIAALRLRYTLRGALYCDDVRIGRQTIAVYQSDRVQIPMSIGLLKKRILVPVHWQRWPESCRQLVLNHELAHIRRQDGWVQVLQVGMKALYGFHPLIWLLNSRLNDLREMACDDLTVGTREHSIEYARFLIRMAEHMIQASLGCPSASAIIKQRNSLVKRVKYQIEEDKMKKQPKAKIWLVGLTLVLGLFAFSWQFNTAMSSPTVKDGQGKLSIHIVDGEKIKLNGKKMGLESLDEALIAVLKEDPSVKYVQLDCADPVRMITVARIQKVLQKHNLLKVVYVDQKQGESPLALPSEKAMELAKKIPPEDLMPVVLKADGSMMVYGKPANMDQVYKSIVVALKKHPKLVLRIDAHPKVLYQSYLKVLQVVKKAGAKRIAVAVQPVKGVKISSTSPKKKPPASKK
jgi:beta-lactamase regulating signal transducer with metallopeptidase domain/biopolymer transport protein ExbD